MDHKHKKVQEWQFKKVSDCYEDIQGPFLIALNEILQDKFFPRFSGKRVLDIGNGGLHPNFVLGGELASKVDQFVGLDANFIMFQRSAPFEKVTADGLALPFKDNSFDYVIINGVIHHLGFDVKEDPFVRVKIFVDEALRVCRQQVVIYELALPRPLEKLERLAGKLLKYMPTFVHSQHTMDRFLQRMNLSREEIISRTASELTHPFYWYHAFIEFPWLKFPAFLLPFRHSFFVVSKNGREANG